MPAEALLAQRPEPVDLVHLLDAEGGAALVRDEAVGVLLEDEERVVVDAVDVLEEAAVAAARARAVHPLLGRAPPGPQRQSERSRYFSSSKNTMPPLPSAVMMWKIEKLVIEMSAREAVCRPRSLPPRVSALSWITNRPCRSATLRTTSQSQIPPTRSGIRIARVVGPIARLDLIDADLVVREADVDEDRRAVRRGRSPRRRTRTSAPA